MVVPVMYLAGSLHRKSTAAQQSSGFPGRASGVWNPISTSTICGRLMPGSLSRVWMRPGATALTRMPSLHQRRARFHVSAVSAAFDDPYPGDRIAERNADIEVVLTTLAPPGAVLLLSRPSQAIVKRIAPNRFCVRDRANPSGVHSSFHSGKGPPALLTRMSSSPSDAASSSTDFSSRSWHCR